MQPARSLQNLEEETITTIPSSGLTSLYLKNFRSYEHLQMGLDSRPVILYGENGAGKTNILEAVSLLSSGRGLRREKLSHMTNRSINPKSWAVSAALTDSHGMLQIGTGYEENPLTKLEKRIIRINGSPIKSQDTLDDFVSVIWLTPAQDRLFQESPSIRRHFLDRLITAQNAEHGQTVWRYEHAVRERLKLLKERRFDDLWLSALEEKIAQYGVALFFNRLEYVAELTQATTWSKGIFPQAVLSMAGVLETWVQETPTAIELEKRFQEELKKARLLDAQLGRTTLGAHKSDLRALYAPKNMAAENCSTGEQKALLLSMIMAASRVQSMRRPGIPLLLLDEVIAHLDQNRRCTLFEEMLNLRIQVWMTGTDFDMFSEMTGNAQVFSVNSSMVMRRD